MRLAKSIFLALLLFVSASFAQDGLITATRNAVVTPEYFNKRSQEVFGSRNPAGLERSLNLYKVKYRSIDANGRTATLSGLVVIPDGGAPKGIVIFNHGTTVYNGHMPSRFTGKENGIEPETAMLAFGSGGYAAVMPDYIGQGDHTGGHPYPANVVNARAGIDLVKPARALMRKINIAFGNDLYVTGYSEGGGVAMAQTRELERMNDPQLRPTASAPASGPYDLSGTTLEFMLQQPTDDFGFIVRVYLLGDLVYGLHKTRGVKITDYFKPSMARTINNAYGGRIKDEDIVKRIGITAVLMRAKNDIFNVVTPRFRKAIESLDYVRDPAVKLLRDNDCYDWAPRTKMLLINLQGDTVVSQKNSEVAFNAMRRRGVGMNSLRRTVILNGELNHLTAVPEAMLRARKFFDSGYDPLVNIGE